MRHWQAKARPHWTQILLGFAALALGVAQVYIYVRQAEIMSTQAQIAEAQQRPWIESAPAAELDVTFDESGHFQAKFKITGTNIGTSPAVEARTSAIVLPGMGPAAFPAPKYQEQTCLVAESGEDMVMFGGEMISALPGKHYGETPTVFPNKEFSTGWFFNQSSPKYIFVQTTPPLPKMLSALLTGCIVYHSSLVNKDWHHTKFAFEINTVRGKGLPFALISDNVIQRDDVRFNESYMALNTAD